MSDQPSRPLEMAQDELAEKLAAERRTCDALLRRCEAQDKELARLRCLHAQDGIVLARHKAVLEAQAEELSRLRAREYATP